MGENKVNGNAGSAVVVDGGSDMGRLGGFLQSQKDEFLQDMRNGGLKGWTVVMGNEAGGKCFSRRYLRFL
jgi:exopolyphosphatase